MANNEGINVSTEKIEKIQEYLRRLEQQIHQTNEKLDKLILNFPFEDDLGSRCRTALKDTMTEAALAEGTISAAKQKMGKIKDILEELDKNFRK